MQPSDVRCLGEDDLPTRFGRFRIHAFEGRSPEGVEEALALSMGDLHAGAPPVVRVHSQCLTGEVLGSQRCDCRAQLHLALARIAEEGRGLLVYEMQEGRGIGLLNKLRAYELQDHGADTVDANERLGFKADHRSYRLAAGILRYFDLLRVRLLTNNPDKIQALERLGIVVADRLPCIAAAAPRAQFYLQTKQDRLGHLLGLQ